MKKLENGDGSNFECYSDSEIELFVWREILPRIFFKIKQLEFAAESNKKKVKILEGKNKILKILKKILKRVLEIKKNNSQISFLQEKIQEKIKNKIKQLDKRIEQNNSQISYLLGIVADIKIKISRLERILQIFYSKTQRNQSNKKS